jgi:hypothetical protein
MAKAKSKKKATATNKTARKAVAALVKAGEAKRTARSKKGSAASERTKEDGRDSTAVVDTGDVARSPSGQRRWKGMSIEQLQALYAETVGRPSGSSDRGYLIWKIREAEKGNVPVGPSKKRTLFDGPTTVVTVKLEDSFLDALDAAAKDDGFTSRLGYMRDLLGKGLEVRGRSELAAKVAG